MGAARFALNIANEAGARAYFYQPETTTPRSAFTDAELSVPITNPAVADANGTLKFYLDDSQDYDIVVNSSDDATILIPRGYYAAGGSTITFVQDGTVTGVAAASNLFGWDADGVPKAYTAEDVRNLLALDDDNDVTFESVTITDSVTANNHATTKQYVDDAIGGVDGEGATLATIAELQAYSTSVSAVRVLGRTAAGDWGEPRVFRWDSSDLSTEVAADEVTSSEGDGGMYVAPASDKTGASGAWVEAEDYINVKWYGARGDGATDDGAALEAAIAAALGLTVRKIYFPAGTYLSARTLTLNTETTWAGAGRDASIIKASASLAQGVSLLQAATLAGTTNVFEQSEIRIEDMTIDGGGRSIDNDSRVALVRVWSTVRPVFENVHFKSHEYILLSIGGCLSPRFIGCEFSDWGHPTVNTNYPEGGAALWLSSNPNANDDTPTTDFLVFNCDFHDSEWSAIYPLSHGGRISQNRFLNTKEAAIYFQDNTDSPAEGADSREIVVENNIIRNVALKYIAAAGIESSARGLSIINNTIIDCVGPGIDMTAFTQDAIIHGNIMYGNGAGNSTLLTLYGTVECNAEILLRLNGDEGYVPSNITISQNVIGVDSTSPTARNAISVRRVPDTGNDTIDNIIIGPNDLSNGYTTAAVHIQSGILGSDCTIDDGSGEIITTQAARTHRRDGGDFYLGVDVDDAQSGGFDYKKDGVLRWRTVIATSEAFELRRFDASGVFQASVVSFDTTTNAVTYAGRITTPSINLSGPLFLSGNGSPEGIQTAPVGSVFLSTNGSTDTTFYVKESGTGNSGWVAK